MSNKNNNYKGRKPGRNSKSTNNNCKAEKRNTNGYGRSNDRVRPEATEEMPNKDYNNPEWRMYNQILDDSVNAFTLNQFVGEPINLGAQTSWKTNAKFNFETIMRVEINPSAGLTWDSLSPVNQSALKMYTTLSANNMKTTQYGPQDVMICLLALGQIVSTASFIMRAFGIITKTNPRNRNWPVGIIRAMGIDPDDFIESNEVYRTRYNILAARASAIAFPSNIPYFSACAALYENIFLDQPNGMGFAYVTVPGSTWILDEISSEQGSKLVTTDLVNLNPNELVLTKMSVILNRFESMIDALLSSATLNYLYTDVLKYFGNDRAKLYTLPMISSGFAVDPVYSEEFLIQLHNARIMGYPMKTKVPLSPAWNQTLNNDVLCDAGTNSIHYAPVFQYNNTMGALRPILNFSTDNPSVTDRVSSLRFMSAAASTDVTILPDGLRQVFIQYHLSDAYISRLVMLQQSGTGWGDMYILESNALVLEGNSTTGIPVQDIYKALTIACDITQFHGAPLLYMVKDVKAQDEGQTTFFVDAVLGDLGTFTVLDDESSKAANETSMLSLLILK